MSSDFNKKYLLLHGGTDINPELYFEDALPTTDTPDNERDRKECLDVAYAIDAGRPIIGICRGAQLLCALNGGKLLQHVPSHRNNSHPIFVYNEDRTDYIRFENVKADHHQVMVPAGNHIVIGKAGDGVPEVVYWPETKCLAVQPHPEWMAASTSSYPHPFNVWLDGLIFGLFGIKGVF